MFNIITLLSDTTVFVMVFKVIIRAVKTTLQRSMKGHCTFLLGEFTKIKSTASLGKAHTSNKHHEVYHFDSFDLLSFLLTANPNNVTPPTLF